MAYDAPDVLAAVNIDPTALRCRYCGCHQDFPCTLNGDDEAVTRIGRDTQACGWFRIVERVGPADEHQSYFAVCTNRACVRHYLTDSHAP